MNDTLIFFGLAALALIFKWLTSKAEKSQAENETHESDSASPRVAPPLRPPPQSEEERVRRFLEALGMPQGTPPPPPVRPRQVVVTPAAAPPQRPKVKRSPVQPLPPLVTTPQDFSPPPIPSVVTVAPVLPEIEIPLPRPRLFLPVPRKAAPIPSVPATSLGAMLRSRGSARQAIVLREVLGPPRGLQPLDSIGARDFL
ncbi:MAG: hypothetical protein ABIR29_03180 [Chthoniobacterales bacterium]